jgi:hypothetical protein
MGTPTTIWDTTPAMKSGQARASALVGEEPDATLAEIQTRLSDTHGLKKRPVRSAE